jgi:hypothetical protein
MKKIMIEPFSDATDQSSFFWCCALVGTGMFILQFLLSFVSDLDNEASNGDAGADSVKFKWVSKQAITGFLMMFGWSALTCQNQFNLPKGMTLMISVVAGLVTVFLIGFIFKTARKLHSSGSIFSLEDIIGKEAVVYQRIPSDGIGKISVSLHQMTHEVDAISDNGEELPSFVTVRIVKKASSDAVIVTQIKQEE